MSSMTLVAGQDHIARSDAIRRRNAETAYNRAEKYNGDISEALEKLERIMIGEKEPNETTPSPQKELKLEAGQLKQIAIPTGKTLEETIDLWRGVRTDAISVPQPEIADHQLAATASAKIRETEAQLGLEQRTKSVMKEMSHEGNSGIEKFSSFDLPSSTQWQTIELQQRYEKAQSSYSFQVDMQKRGFLHEMPSISEVA